MVVQMQVLPVPVDYQAKAETNREKTTDAATRHCRLANRTGVG